MPKTLTLTAVVRRRELAARRLAEANPGGPEWDAARADWDELDAAYHEHRTRIAGRQSGSGRRQR